MGPVLVTAAFAHSGESNGGVKLRPMSLCLFALERRSWRGKMAMALYSRTRTVQTVHVHTPSVYQCSFHYSTSMLSVRKVELLKAININAVFPLRSCATDSCREKKDA